MELCCHKTIESYHSIENSIIELTDLPFPTVRSLALKQNRHVNNPFDAVLISRYPSLHRCEDNRESLHHHRVTARNMQNSYWRIAYLTINTPSLTPGEEGTIHYVPGA